MPSPIRPRALRQSSQSCPLLWRTLSAALLSISLTGPALACGPSAPLSSVQLLDYQIGIIERGLKREALTDAQRAQIATLRAEVERHQKANDRNSARAAMSKIVAMFSHKEMFGAVEPPVPGCAGPSTAVLSGTLLDITIEPNVPGARCGNHYMLSVKDSAGHGAIEKLRVYDLAKAPYDTLKAMLGKPVEIDRMGAGVVGIRLADHKSAEAAGLKGLSPRKPC